MEQLRILLADDHHLVRAGLEMIINRETDMLVVGQASNGVEALQKAAETNADLVIMDLNMKVMNGLEATSKFTEKQPNVKVLAVSVHDDRYHVRKALREGAAGYCPKNAAVSDLILAIRTVAAGIVYIHPSLAKGLVSLLNESDGRLQPRGQRKELSERENDVIRLLALGYSNKEIAAQLKVGIKSVDTYKIRSMEKLGLKNRVEIVQFAKNQGLLDEL